MNKADYLLPDESRERILKQYNYDYEAVREDYCSCGAAQGIADGYYCTSGCSSQRVIKDLKEYERKNVKA